MPFEYEEDELLRCPEDGGHTYPAAAGVCPIHDASTPTPEQIRGQRIDTGTMGTYRIGARPSTAPHRITDEDEEG
jgi:hypothetical protein